MSRLKLVLWCSLVFVVLLLGASVRAVDIDLMALAQETQRLSQKPDEITIVWWIPEEFWKASLLQTPDMTVTQVEEFLKVIRPYTMVAVVDGSIGTIDGNTFTMENEGLVYVYIK